MLTILGFCCACAVLAAVRGERAKAHQRQGDAGQSYEQAD